LNVSFTFALFLLATSAVLVTSNFYWVATVVAASLTCSSKDFLDSSGLPWARLDENLPKEPLWSKPPLA